MGRRQAPLLVGIIVIVALVAYVTLYRSSPGELAKAHAAVAGSPLISDCNKCHAQKDVTPGCLQCHSEIQQQLSGHSGYHGYILKDKTASCATCHSEHNGSKFPLINPVSWPNRDFRLYDHAGTSYKLKDAHTKLKCEQCHSKPRKTPWTLPKFPKQPREHTYLGLTQACMSCHADPHAGGRASQCQDCHDQKKFKPAPFFNHDKFFPLTGVHAKVSCIQCHKKNDLTQLNSSMKSIFGPVRGKRCMDCHSNPHHVDWKQRCESCHSVASPWSAASARFTRAQHAATGFPLVAPHDRTSCASCHKPGISFVKRYPDPRSDQRRVLQRCESCHSDPHEGQWTARYPHCTDCHTVRGFKPSHFTASDHKKYPLVGGHTKATCTDCHTPARGGMKHFRGTPTECAKCHRDVHYGQFRVEGVTDCLKCHRSATDWKRLHFDHNRQSRFPLDQAHENVACKDCHPMVTLPTGARIMQYRPLRMKCRDCHDFDNR